MCEQETFLSLLGNAAHWEFELFLMLVFDGLIGAIAWPIAKRMWLRSQERKKCCDNIHPHIVTSRDANAESEAQRFNGCV